ncbi:MAG: putative S-adenosylmethionine-dependent methyltransferase [Verrucomicrobia bacterium ADurb.Bin345]|nr:MAG: putative S-adenosylmethionine-dependent methyltransferase [Verrucomicrobia bacterium ADurb.Bin345]
MNWQTRYIHRFYRSRDGWTDGTQDFHALCREFIHPSSRVLEIGPGAGGQTSEFLAGLAASVVGLDVDQAAVANPHLREVRIYNGGSFPFDDGSFDAVVSDYALEHVENPCGLLAEVHRVLAPGGWFIFRTPNVVHYVSILSRFFPDRLSCWARNRAADHEVYPKFFRCNSARKCRRLLKDAGLEVAVLKMIEKEPSYGLGSRILFLAMMAYERMVNSSNLWQFLRANILCAARRNAS